MSYMTIFPHKKNTIFHSVHAFTHVRQHYFSKYLGDQCMGGPPTYNFGGTVPPVPPRSPPLLTPVGSDGYELMTSIVLGPFTSPLFLSMSVQLSHVLLYIV